MAVQGDTALADMAREAFVHAMSRASIVVAVVAALGAVVAWRYLPARAAVQDAATLAPARSSQAESAV